jgi:hypothetical protein
MGSPRKITTWSALYPSSATTQTWSRLQQIFLHWLTCFPSIIKLDIEWFSHSQCLDLLFPSLATRSCPKLQLISSKWVKKGTYVLGFWEWLVLVLQISFIIDNVTFIHTESIIYSTQIHKMGSSKDLANNEVQFESSTVNIKGAYMVCEFHDDYITFPPSLICMTNVLCRLYYLHLTIQLLTPEACTKVGKQFVQPRRCRSVSMDAKEHIFQA